MKSIKLGFATFCAVLLFIVGCSKDDTPEKKDFVFPSKVINKIYVDQAGVKWFATEAGVISYNGTVWTSYSDDKKLSNGSIADFAFEPNSSKNIIWLASTSGVSVFNFGENAISFINYNHENSGLPDNGVSAIEIDKSNVKYIGTAKGLSILNGEHWENFTGRATEEILAKYKISSVAATSNNYVYAATTGGGISRIKYTDAVSGATTLNRDWTLLPSDTVYTVLADGVGQWYGTARGAAFHASEYTKIDWTAYTRADGLVCDSVYAIAKGLSGDVWFGTHKGVSRFSGETWASYTMKDGLPANKINALAVDLDGSLWVGTDNGISHFANDHWVNF